jgi:hypothetical protein
MLINIDNNFLDYYQSTSIKVRVVDGSHVANGFNHGAWRTIHILPMVSTMALNGPMGIGMAIVNTIPTTLPLVFYYENR